MWVDSNGDTKHIPIGKITDYNGKQTLCCSREYEHSSFILLPYTNERREKNWNHCYCCGKMTSTMDKVSKDDLLTEEEKELHSLSSKKNYFKPTGSGGMGYIPSTVGKLIFHGGNDKLVCGDCTLRDCGVRGCTFCPPGAIHRCRCCNQVGANHFTRNCPLNSSQSLK
jgi:hypothetical protein